MNRRSFGWVCLGAVLLLAYLLHRKKKKILKVRRRTRGLEMLPPSGLPVLRVCFNFEEIRPCIVQLIQRASKEIRLSTFNTSLFTPFVGEHTLNDYLYAAHLKGVSIHLALNARQGAYGGDSVPSLCDLPYAVYASQRDDCTFLNQSYCHHHQKFLCVDASFLLIGGTESSKDATNKPFNTCDTPDIHCWTDSAVVTYCTPELYAFILKTSFASEYSSDCALRARYFGNGDSEHNLYVNLIRAADAYVYVENQVFISHVYTANRLLEEICAKIVTSVETGTAFKVFLVTNDYRSTIDECHAVRKYIDVQTKNVRRNAFRMCQKASSKPLTEEDLDEHLFVGTLEHRRWPVKVHSQLFVQDGIRMIKGSSNITDRSLSSTPCDKELTVLFHGAPEISTFMTKLWNHRLETEGEPYDAPRVFALAQKEKGQYRSVRQSSLDYVVFLLVSNLILFLQLDGPCAPGVFRQSLKGGPE